MKKVIAIIGLTVCALYIPAALLFFGGAIFGADMEPYALVFGIWGVYDIGYILGLGTDEVLKS